jgi:plastocyanin
MRKPGVIAFPVLLVLGAITGFIAYNMLIIEATPKAGEVQSPYRKDLPVAGSTTEKPVAAEVDKSKFSNAMTIDILAGAVTQGNPDYGPEPAKVSSDALITWVNRDSAPHSATSGKGFDDPDFGQLFDSGILETGKEYSIPASDLGKGEHPYFCIVHPYMTSTIIVE